MKQDVLTTLYNELRTQLPPLPAMMTDGDRRTTWLANLAQVLQAMKTPEQQWACLTDIADHLNATQYPGLPLAVTYGWLAQQCQLEHVLPLVQATHRAEAMKDQKEHP